MMSEKPNLPTKKRKSTKWIVLIGICVLAYLFIPRSKPDSIESRFRFDASLYDDDRDASDPAAVISPGHKVPAGLPNIVVILTDDLGYGDLGCYGSRSIRTPHIDRLAEEGIRFTDFYSASAICTPSRAGLLTGRYPHRTGITFPYPAGKDSVMRKTIRRIGLGLGSLGIVDTQGGHTLAPGLPQSEITIAEALKLAGYRTGCIGKWHLGDFLIQPKYHPLKHGFDYFMGINGANDDWPVGLWRDNDELIANIGLEQGPYTGMFTEEAIGFIERSKAEPFFLYLGHKDPHQPCIPSEAFAGRSQAGPFGDTVEEVDDGVGKILSCLKRNGIDQDTLIIFTSDNGPWYNGSPGVLRGRKGQGFDGGYRVPLIVRWPSKIAPGQTCGSPTMAIDLFPTALELANLQLPTDRVIDGKSMAPLFRDVDAPPPHEALYFIHHNELEGIRSGKWKYFRYVNSYVYPVPLDKPHTAAGRLAGGYEYQPEGSDVSVSSLGSWPLLYDVELDPGENYNLIERHPEEGARLQAMMEDWEKAFVANPRGWLNRSGK